MTYQIFQLPKQSLIGGAAIKPSFKVNFFLTGTTTPTPVYTTSALSVAHTQPVQADSGGVLATVYLDPSIVYKASVYDQNDVLQYTVDPVNDSLLSAAAIGAALYPRTAAEISAGVTPTNYAYPPGDARRYGMVGDGTQGASSGTDNTAAFDRLVSVCKGPNVTAFIPNGTYRFASKPATITTAITIEGESKGGVIFLRDYSESTATNGFIEINSGSLVIENIYLLANNSHSGGTAIKLLAQAGGASPDFSTIKAPYISGTSGTTWEHGIFVDGSARTSAPAGIRDLLIDDTNVFACQTSCITLKSVNNAQVNCAVFPAGGTAQNLMITGVGGNLSNDIQVRANFCPEIDLDYCNYLQILVSGSVDITNTSNVTGAQVMASSVASYESDWLASVVMSEDGYIGNVSSGVGFYYGEKNSYVGNSQTISTATGQTIDTSTGVVQNINNTAGANLTGTILEAGTYPYQQVEVMNANGFTIAFDVEATSNVADGATSVIPALSSRKFTWNASLSRWYRAA